MAQISIPMSNKVGCSMFWNSMWDCKINFSRSLKEDLYLRQFVPLIFNDRISTKIFKTIKYKKPVKIHYYNKFNLQSKLNELNKNDFLRYMKNINKTLFYSSKVWIFKYQKWVIIFFFMYLPKFNNLKKKKNNYVKRLTLSNVNNMYGLYKSAFLKSKYSYTFFSNSLNKNNF